MTRFQLEHVTIRYGQRLAVEDLSVAFGDGIVGLLGQNGAGKSSVLRCLLGLVVPVAGQVRMLGGEAAVDGRARLTQIGYMPERDAYLPQATGAEMVAMLGMLSGLERRSAWRRAHEVLYLVGLEEQRYRPVSGYSTGMRQKAKLAAALVHDPGVLLLDEPTSGLDPAGRQEMLELCRQVNRELGKSIVLSTHILHDVESACDRVVVLDRGRLVVEGGLAELTSGVTAEFELDTDPGGVEVLHQLRQDFRVTMLDSGRFAVTLPAARDPAAVFAAVRRAGASVRSLQPRRRTLEHVFLEAVRGDHRASSAQAST